MEYTVRRAMHSDLQNLYEFNDRYYPGLNHGREYVDFWCSKSDDAVEKILLMVDNEDNILAQNFFSTMSYYYQGEKIDTVWGFDLIVNEDCRKENLGVMFMLKHRDAERNMLSVGANDNALSMLLNMRYKLIGELKKYIGIVNPFHCLIAPFRGVVQSQKFPSEIYTQGAIFKKLSEDNIFDLEEPYNPELLEPARDKQYLIWRFFGDFHDYVFYKSSKSNDYFVVRPILKHHIAFLELVDYRCNLSDNVSIISILSAYKKIAKQMCYGFLFTGSSLGVVDSAMEAAGLKRVGRNRPIIWLKKNTDVQDKINNRNFVYLTLADSDGEVAL